MENNEKKFYFIQKHHDRIDWRLNDDDYSRNSDVSLQKSKREMSKDSEPFSDEACGSSEEKDPIELLSGSLKLLSFELKKDFNANGSVRIEDIAKSFEEFLRNSHLNVTAWSIIPKNKVKYSN